MNYKFIKFEIKDNYSKIIFNRPEVLNSFNKQMAKEVQHALDEARSNELVRALLLKGEGRAFSAGQDLAEAVPVDSPKADLEEILTKSYNPIIEKIRNMPKPVIAAVNGVAAGAGANIALACDIVVASEKASFIQAFVNIGLIPDSGGTYFLPRQVGFPKAAALMMLGEKISSSDAEKMGMIYKSYSDGDFETETEKLVLKISNMPTKAIALIKEALNASMNNTMADQLKLEVELQSKAGSSYDYDEGVKAFKEKRAPKYKGE